MLPEKYLKRLICSGMQYWRGFQELMGTNTTLSKIAYYKAFHRVYSHWYSALAVIPVRMLLTEFIKGLLRDYLDWS